MEYVTSLKRMNAEEFGQELARVLLCVTTDPECCELTDLLFLKDHARINGYAFETTQLQHIINDITRKERQTTAANLVLKNSKSLRMRLLRARSCLARKYREQFKDYTFDKEHHRLLSESGQGSLALQWTNDGETTVGSVALVELGQA